MEAKKDTVTWHELRHDGHTVSLLTDHLVFSPKYRGKVLLGEVAEATEEIVIDEEKEKALKIGYMTLYAKLFMPSQECDSEKKRKSFYGL